MPSNFSVSTFKQRQSPLPTRCDCCVGRTNWGCGVERTEESWVRWRAAERRRALCEADGSQRIEPASAGRPGREAYSGYQPFVFNRLIKDLWLGDSDNEYSHSAFWKECPNAEELGLAATDSEISATDMNAADMNAIASADAALNAASNAVENADTSVQDAQPAPEESAAPDESEQSYDVNNDGGE